MRMKSRRFALTLSVSLLDDAGRKIVGARTALLSLARRMGSDRPSFVHIYLRTHLYTYRDLYAMQTLEKGRWWTHKVLIDSVTSPKVLERLILSSSHRGDSRISH